MPLSEHEQKILQEIEKNLYSEDPRFAHGRRSSRNRSKLGAIVFVVGFVILIGFFISRSLLVGVAAFGAMVAGIVLLAGSLPELIPSAGSQRDRLTGAFSRLEKRLRERYKKPE